MITTLLSPKIKRFPPIVFPATGAIIPLIVESEWRGRYNARYGISETILFTARLMPESTAHYLNSHLEIYFDHSKALMLQ